MSPMKNRNCLVCGDVALCLNFFGLTCKSCKSFFRRYALKKNVSRCLKNNLCIVDINTRTFCKKCRLDRCLEIGMKKELIFSKKEMAKTKIMHKNNDFKSNFNLQLYDMQMLQEVQAAVANFTSGFVSKQLNFPEEQNENNLPISSKNNNLIVTSIPDSLPEVFDSVEPFVRASVRFCKRFPAFAVLQQDDQLVILKDAFPAIFAVYNSFAYNRQQDGFLLATNENSAAFVRLKFSSPMQNITAIFRRFANALNKAMNGDETIRDLLIAQILFRQQENVRCTEFVRYNYVFYCYLLQKYLCTKLQSSAKGHRKYIAIQSILTEMACAGHSLRRLYASTIDVASISQLVAEIYRLI